MTIRTKIANWMSKSRPRLYFLIVLLMLLPIPFFAYSVTRVLRQQTEKQAITESTQIARVSAVLIDQHFRQSTAFLEAFAVRHVFRQAWMEHNFAEVDRHLEQAIALRPDFLFFSVYDLDGTMRAIYPAQPTVVNKNFAQRDWYQGVAGHWKPYVSEIYETAVTPHQLVVAIAVPIRDSEGKPVGILMAPYALNTISRWLGETKLEGAWKISLVDQKGHLSASPTEASTSALIDLSEHEPVKLVRAGRTGNGIFARNNQLVFTHYEPVAEYGWGLLLEQPSATLQQGVWAVGRRVWLLGALFLVVGLGVSLFMGSLYARLETGNRFIDLSIDMFCIAGFDGFFKSLNPVWEKVLGFTTEELKAKPYLDFIHPEDRQATAGEAQRLQTEELTFGFENRYLCKDGSYKWLLWNCVSVPEHKAIYAVAHDVTESKRALQKIEQQNHELEARNQEVERATQLKSKFLASMSHELRTPLNAIVGFSGLLAEKTAGPLNEKQQRFINHIKQGADHLLQLINDILDLSKIESGLLEIRCEDFRVASAMPEVLSIVRPLAMTKKIDIEQSLPDLWIHADRIRFKQILYNLLSNALKFTPEGGKVRVDCASQNAFVYFAVSDTGVGIRLEDQQVIFQEFRQVGETTRGVKEGTGLGLAITKRLVEQQSGTINVESELGRGTTFSFTLPAGKELSRSTEDNIVVDTPPGESTSGKPLILVVDDELSARELLASYLEPMGYRTAMASAGAEALVKARELHPDAITLDIQMPGRSAFETIFELKNTPATADIPVIVVSVVDQKRMGLALGAVEYLVKPVNKDIFLEAIHKHVHPGRGAAKNILLVDDDPKTLDLVSNILRSAGYIPHAVASGKVALQRLSEVHMDAILLDLVMPEMDGFEVLRRIKEQPTLGNIPVLVLTGKDLTEAEIALLKNLAKALLRKNDSWKADLLGQIRNIVGHSRLAKSVGQS
ncbi:MAG TPA: response regulator [Terriglobales bacterium]|nr:response regulator [Terriglobales bacterium]